MTSQTPITDDKLIAKLRDRADKGGDRNDGFECCDAPNTCIRPDILIQAAARLESLERRVRELSAALGEAEKDAERYRWLRDVAPVTVRTRIVDTASDFGMDAAIDKALSPAAPETGQGEAVNVNEIRRSAFQEAAQFVANLDLGPWRRYGDLQDRIAAGIQAMGYDCALPPQEPQPAGQWIPVTERVPEGIYSVLVWVKEEVHDDYRDIGIYVPRKAQWQVNDGDDDKVVNVTHWMPLPTAPHPGARRRGMRTITLYRDDSTVQVVFERVKHVFWTAGNTVLVIAQYIGDGPEHHYIHWPRERFCWFRDVPLAASAEGKA